MRVLVVSQYYAPEVGATQNRMGAFVDRLVGEGHSVTVVCEQPNHPAGVFHDGFGRRPLMTERRAGLTVHRLWVAASPHKTTARRLGFYASFAAGAVAAIAALPRHDVAFATSPPLPGALAAGAALRLRRTPLVLDVRDLWPAAAQALGELSNRRVLRAFEHGERWLYRSSVRVTATTRPFCEHIDRVAGRPVAVHLPNGALDDLVGLEERPPRNGGPLRIGYAGNFGIAQGLGIVLDAAERLRGEDVRFVLLGEGPLRAEIAERCAHAELENVELRPGVPVAEVGEFLLSCDALLIPLRAHARLGDFIPSKLYDAMAVGRAAIVAVEGEAAALTREADCGLVIPPEDGAALAEVARRLASDRQLLARLGATGKSASRGMTRSRQAARLSALLGEVAGSSSPRTA